MTMERFDVWFQPADAMLPTLQTLFTGLTKNQAIGYVSAKNFMLEGRDNASKYFFVPMKTKRTEYVKPDLFIAPDKKMYAVYESINDYDYLWSKIYRCASKAACLMFLRSLDEFYDRDRHYILCYDNEMGKILASLPRDRRKVGLC